MQNNKVAKFAINFLTIRYFDDIFHQELYFQINNNYSPAKS